MTSEIETINTYHDHKEKMAWTVQEEGQVFYLGILGVLGAGLAIAC